jgi:hypothetical protein
MDKNRKEAINTRKRKNYHCLQGERLAEKNNSIVNNSGKKLS